ncbi:MAG TPA: tyrosine protein kinase [Lachnoclostridium phytofermentans]|uniref:non-specific protein-tyrosine kinase n=2 Tax=Lachnoclostridium TaxID=1506553 RepID=A0A3D2X7H6_9FIRM|nr:tyrosine protein kinase [Lachnoclostridium phytofermentans]
MKYSNKKRKNKKPFWKKRKEDNILSEHSSIEKGTLEFTSNEAYKSLRTNIQFCGKEVKTICITSSLPNEGKTVVSFRLATAFAESGKKVLFIDADLRKSVIISRLKIDNAVNGLSQYLSGMNCLEEVIYKSKENLDIIFTGILPPNPSEMLGSDEFKNLVKTQREVYDYIIIDTPPLGVVIDSANVADICDGTILVLESNKISYRFAQRVLKQLNTGKSKVLGAVLNKVNIYGLGYNKKYYGKYYNHVQGNNFDKNGM